MGLFKKAKQALEEIEKKRIEEQDARIMSKMEQLKREQTKLDLAEKEAVIDEAIKETKKKTQATNKKPIFDFKL